MSYVGKLVAIALIATLGTTVGARVAAEPSAGQRKLAERLQAISEKAEQGDCQSTLAMSRDVVKQAQFATLAEPVRVMVYETASYCASEVKDGEAAYLYALEGTRLRGASAWLWRVRLARELNDERNAPAVATIEALASKNAEGLNGVPIQWFYSLSRNVKQDAALRRRLLAVLTAPTFQPEQALVTGDPFKRDYAALLADAGDKSAAAALVGRIVEPSLLIDVSLDPRLRAMLPADFDPRAALKRRLAQARDIAASLSGSTSAAACPSIAAPCGTSESRDEAGQRPRAGALPL